MKIFKNNSNNNFEHQKKFPRTKKTDFLYKILLASKANEQGSGLVFAFSVGLLLLILGTATIITSGQNKTNAVVNEKAVQALATTEAGVNRSMTKLNKDYPYYLKLSYDPINPNTTKQYLGTDGFPDTLGDNSSTALDEWSSPPTGSTSSPCAPASSSTLTTAVLNENLGLAGNSKLLAYRFDGTDTGYLLVEGEKTEGNVSSKARLQLELTIGERVPPASFPGLYADTFVSMANNTLDPETAGDPINLICTDCTSSLPTNCTNGTPDDNYLEDAIDLGPNGDVEGNIVIGEPELPPLPDPPINVCSSTQAPPCYILHPPMTSGGPYTLPRAIDIANRISWGHPAGDTYNYILEHGGSPQYRSIHNQSVTVDTTTASVRLYVTGNIDIGGSATLTHTGSFEKFAIFGCTTEVDTIYSCISPMTDQEFTLSGGGTATSVFIFALNAAVGVNGGSNDPDFKAVIWANTWGTSGSTGTGSSSSNVNIVVPDNPSTLLASEFGTVYGEAGIPVNVIESINSQQRVKAE